MPGQRQEIAKRKNRKVTAQVYHAKQLSGWVQAIWTTLEHGTSAYFHPGAPLVARHAQNAYAYLREHSGDTFRATRALLAEFTLKLLFKFHHSLWKAYGCCIASSTDRAAYNLMGNFPGDVVPLERLNKRPGRILVKALTSLNRRTRIASTLATFGSVFCESLTASRISSGACWNWKGESPPQSSPSSFQTLVRYTS